MSDPASIGPLHLDLPEPAGAPLQRGLARLARAIHQAAAPPAPRTLRLRRADTAAADCWDLSATPAGDLLLHGATDRALMYGLYRLAESIQLGEDLATLELQRCPLIPRRVAFISAKMNFGQVFLPEVYRQTLDELPALGFNTVNLVVSRIHASDAGSPRLPVAIGPDGERRVRDTELATWRRVLAEIKSYGFDTCLTIPCSLPAGIDADALRHWYAGKGSLADPSATLAAHAQALAAALYELLPDLDGLVLHSLECEEVWYDAVSPFPAKAPDRGAAALAAYLDGLLAAGAAAQRFSAFWTHVSALPPAQLRLLRRLTAARPELIQIEDAHWPNVGWPTLPFLGYLPDDLRAAISRRPQLGICLTTTDGEYYGAGSLPSADPAPFVAAADAAVQAGAAYLVMRLNTMDRSGLGTLFCMNGVMPAAAADRLWAPQTPMADSVRRWCRLRGGDSAPLLEKLLACSRDVLQLGFTYRGLNLLDHSGISPWAWLPHRGGRSRYALFADSSRPLAPGPYDRLSHQDYLAWQVRATPGTLAEFHDRQAKAKTRNQIAIDLLAADDTLDPETRRSWLQAHRDGDLALDAILALGNAAHAANRAAADPDALDAACAVLRACADRIEARRGPNFMPTIYLMHVSHAGKSHPYSPIVPVLRHLHDAYRRLSPAPAATH